ncbi:GAF domain-containing protein [Lusitaniella coriacea LEGE 07157]|uniref:Circadian input-output histidine kinase CikA n=1 Tax=Lusitaniella coriacea LEGE 07157 TaxID=945747 RepID=A0A8J7DYX5_9CYAN|nr:GAF domain-containing protein [Lusitaniella coriacea]MBE9118132.1 GAF domain-containing protein [Lusitaniella coriacea LEGE 07157]
MSQPQLHSLPPLRLLIVADGTKRCGEITESIENLSSALSYDCVENITQYKFFLSVNAYDGVVFDDPLPQELSLLTALAVLQESGQQIPAIAIAPTPSDRAAIDYLQGQNFSYLPKKALHTLPNLLMYKLSQSFPPISQSFVPTEIESHRNQQATLKHFLQIVGETQEVNRLLQIAANLLQETLKLNACTIALPDAEREMEVRYVSEATPRRERFFEQEPVPPLNRASILPVMPDSLAAIAAVESRQDCSIVTIPLWRDRARLGSICLHDRPEERQWSEGDVNFIKTIATQCAIAIERDRLSQQLQQQQKGQQLFTQIAQILNSRRDAESLLQEIIGSVGEHFAVDRVLLLRLRDDSIGVAKEWRDREKIPSLLNIQLPIAEWQELLTPDRDYPLHRYFHTDNYPEYCAQKQQTRKISEWSQTRSLLSIPICTDDRLVGGLTLQTIARSRTFTSAEIELASTIANQLAIALTALQKDRSLEEEVIARTQHLEAANRAKSELLSTMSHELRTPLTSIIGFARMLQERIYGELNDKQGRYVNAISDSGEHLLSLINDLLDISKIEAKREELYIEAISIEDVCLSSLSILQERAKEQGLELKCEIHPNATVCYADRRRLKQILVNLLSNAIKFTEEGSITLQVEPNGDWLKFSAIDTGIGISEADLHKLFQPFQQVKTHLHRKHKGTGLGLALSRKLAQLHKGELTVTSKIGKGSCFTLHLPIEPDLES